jgi:prepilin-type N-terminal cleavage/methylation domain-containing protein
MRKFARGFTLIEILVVLVIAGLLAGVALPRLHTLSRRFEIAAEHDSLLSEIGNLGYRAYASGKGVELGNLPASATIPSPIKLPLGWRIEAQPPISYNSNGICNGGKIRLLGPEDFREDLQLTPPLCRPATAPGLP